MIAWSIEAAQHTKLFDRIVVSLMIRKSHRLPENMVHVPFVRPAKLSDDHTGTAPVIAHAIEWHLKHDFDPTEICCIYATAPFFK